MTRPPNKWCTLLLAACLASCSDKEDESDAGGGIGGGGEEAGAEPMDASNGSEEGGAPGRDGSQALPGGGDDAGRTDGGGAGDSGAGGNDAGGDDGGGQPPGCSASAAPNVGKLGLETVVSGLSNFVFAAQPPGVNDWYLVQQSGQLLVRAAGATTNSTLLDVSNEITLSSGFGDDERGLLGLAFAPDFATSGIFYVMMTPTSGGNQDQVRQYRKMGSSAMLVDTILTLPGSAVNHNGGQIVMHDGLLYVGTGDGGGTCNNDKAGTPQQITMDMSSWFGKILRLDPARKANGYAAEGNPFPESPLVYHYGLRNPYRFSFDRANGDLYIGDVGQGAYEEVNFAKAGVKGLNFGWGAYENESMTCPGRTLRTGSTQTKPVFAADRRQSGCMGRFCDWKSVIGGVVYRGSAVPALSGAYLTGDYVGVRMAAFYQCDTMTSPTTIVGKRCDPNMPNQACFQNSTLDSLVAIVEDNAGEIYFVANRNALMKVVAVP